MSIARRVGRFSTATCLVGIMGVAAVGCLSRPAVKGDPTTKTNFVSKVRQQAVDKIDLVLAVDNSASMGDKQTFLARAVPKLVSRLVTPSCVAKGQGVKDEDGLCTNGDDVEFRPIKDIHIAVVTSSMGGFGSSTCADDPAFNNNDRGLPIPRERAKGADGKAVDVEAEDGNFLAWFPDSEDNKKKPQPAKPYTDAAKLSTSVANLIRGAGENGCGLEAQLESVYRFLIQPDPWNAIKTDGGRATYDGVANDVIKARKNFLRNDSLVAVIMLTDEDDSSVDPMSIAGSGWAFMANDFPTSSFVPPDVANSPGRKRAEKDFLGGTTAPKGTTACETAPMSKDCTSCAFKYGCSNFLDAASCKKLEADANCADNGGYHTQATDSLNVRFHRMKQRYGVDPQYPLKRYVAGFTRQVVPNRLGEHNADGTYADDTNGVHGCTNPLFAKVLPESADALANDAAANAAVSKKSFGWCQSARGDRDEGLVFFAVVGGVPNDLLHFDPTNADASNLTEDDWIKIVGKDPTNFNYADVDQRMYQSITPRTGRRTDGLDSPADDPLNTDHRDWDTRNFDLQYACTFPLPPDLQRDLTPANARAFDCTANSDAPLCSSDKPKTEIRKQIRAKAYPTVRELQVARLLGAQGIAASLCPQKATGSEDDPLFGYNPAVAAVVDRLKNALTAQCLPRPLTADPANGEVQCLMIEELPLEDTRACSSIPGRSEVPTDVAARFREAQKAEQGANVSAAEDRTKRKICQIKQLKAAAGESCRFDEAGWCYVAKTDTKNPAGRCSQAIVFSDNGVKAVPGGTVNLQCIDQQGSGTATK